MWWKLTCCGRTAEVHTDRRLHAPLEAVHVGAVEDAVAHGLEHALEVGTAEVGARLELRQRVMIGPNTIEDDVLLRVHVELLREVGVDLEELHAVAAGDARRLRALRLERRQQRLEPLERARVLAHPDELHAAQAPRRVRAVAQVPDVLQDRRPRGDADTRADEDGDFVLEHVLRGGTVGSVDSQHRHLLSVLQGHLVHAHGINALV